MVYCIKSIEEKNQQHFFKLSKKIKWKLFSVIYIQAHYLDILDLKEPINELQIDTGRMA